MKKNKLTHDNSVLDKIYRVLSHCSIKCLFKLAKILAFIATHTKNKISNQTRLNIELCFPELTKKDQKKLITQSILHTCCAFIELASLWHQPIHKVLELIKIKKIDDIFFNTNKPRIIIAPHHGSWELLNLWLANQGLTYSLYKPAKSDNVDKYILSKRTRNGAQLVPVSTSGLRQLITGLRDKASCMILPDQRPAQNTAQISAPFFDNPAPTSLLIKRLAKTTDSNIFIASVTRNLQRGDYQLTIKSLTQSEFLSDDLSSATYLNQSIQDFIQGSNSQYQWSYRRFHRKTYPH